MGCSTTSTLENQKELQQAKIDLSFSSKSLQNELQHAQVIISLITKIRNRLIYLYHKLIYSSAACVYSYPSITFVLRNIFYKISADFKGDLLASNIMYIEDPPYLQCQSIELLSQQAKELLQELFDFMVEIIGYKQIIKQIDKETPELLFLIFEKKDVISEQNSKKLNEAVELFDKLTKLRINIIKAYKDQVYFYVTKTNMYCHGINKIGKEAFKRGFFDIYEIAMLKKNEIIEENIKLKKIVINKEMTNTNNQNNNENKKKENDEEEEEIKFKEFDKKEIESIKTKMETIIKNDIKEEINNLL